MAWWSKYHWHWTKFNTTDGHCLFCWVRRREDQITKIIIINFLVVSVLRKSTKLQIFVWHQQKRKIKKNSKLAIWSIFVALNRMDHVAPFGLQLLSARSRATSMSVILLWTTRPNWQKMLSMPQTWEVQIQMDHFQFQIFSEQQSNYHQNSTISVGHDQTNTRTYNVLVRQFLSNMIMVTW